MLNNSTKSMKEIVESIKGNSFVDLEKERILFNDQVRRLLEASKRKNIILIIDDMDRTYHKENIIKLLSEFSSINGLITIVSLNKELNKKEEGQEYNELDKYIHIIIHRLLLCGGNDHGREHGLQIGYFGIDTAADVVFGKAMMRDGRTTGHDLRITADKSFRLYALLHFQKVRIAV